MHFIVDAEPAARQAGAARPLAQRVVLEEDRVVLLQHLGGLGLRDADGGAAVGEAVVLGAPAVPAAREDVHDVVPLLSGSKPPSVRLPLVPAGAANRSSGIARASATKTLSAMRELTSAAQPETGR